MAGVRDGRQARFRTPMAAPRAGARMRRDTTRAIWPYRRPAGVGQGWGRPAAHGGPNRTQGRAPSHASHDLPYIPTGLGRSRGLIVLFLDRAVVPCPVRGDIDLELCFACPYLRDAAGDPISRIECDRRVPLADAEPAV